MEFSSYIAGLRLKIAKEVLGLTVDELALKLGYSKRTLDYWLSGESFSHKRMLEVSGFLEIDPIWFTIDEKLFSEDSFSSAILKTMIGLQESKGGLQTELVLRGTDTLILVKLLNHLTSNSQEHPVLLEVSGKSKIGKTKVQGELSDVHLDRYIRSIAMESNFGEFSVGGVNATAEDIAADKITLRLNDDQKKLLIDTQYAIFLRQRVGASMEIDVSSLLKLGLYSSAIILLKMRGDIPSLERLQSIDDTKLSTYSLQLKYEAFRAFGPLYSEFPFRANEILKYLIQSVDWSLDRNEITTAIYCVESMAPTLINIESYILYKLFVARQIRNSSILIDDHFAWALYVCLSNSSRFSSTADEIDLLHDLKTTFQVGD